MTLHVRRVGAEEWQRVRELRLDALQDPDAAIAFLDTHDNALQRPAAFWQERTVGAATSDTSAQFVAEEGAEWLGTATVLRRDAGHIDHHGVMLPHPRSDVVGVYVRPSARGRGVINALLAAAASWARSLGDDALLLDVHADNARAQAAYRRAGFTLTGHNFTSVIGDEVEMRWPLSDAGDSDRVPS